VETPEEEAEAAQEEAVEAVEAEKAAQAQAQAKAKAPVVRVSAPSHRRHNRRGSPPREGARRVVC